jgi:hypothetical protein
MMDVIDNQISQSPPPQTMDSDLRLYPAGLPDDLARDLDALPEAALPHFRIDNAPLGPLLGFVGQLATTPGLDPALALVLADVAAQARRFAELTGATALALKLERVTDDACRKLHHDYVAHRLVVTYRGQGTQWLPRALEAALGAERLRVDDSWLHSVPRFSAALFTGRLLPGGNPVLHRSPPIAGTGQVRLVLTINEPFAARH